jgi:uncharacterized membrane protein YcaP (DUF421 family)
MSSKRYQFKVVESGDSAELETLLRQAGSQQWSAVGYGILPDGRRSVLLERKVKVHHQKHHDRHRRHQHDQADDRQGNRTRDDHQAAGKPTAAVAQTE